MKKLTIFLLLPLLAIAGEVESGALVRARLLTPVSSTRSKVGDPVNLVVTAGVLKGSRIGGRVTQVSTAQSNRRALIKLEFNGMQLVEVDNARESVDASGRIVGILASETLAGVLKSLGVVFTREADPEIQYPAGTDFILRLTRPMSGPVTASPVPVVDPGLAERIQRMPVRTVAQSPKAASDVTNVVFLGSGEDLVKGFAEAGWTAAKDLNAASVVETAIAIIESRGYHEAPVSTLLLEGRLPDFVFQKMTNTFAERHHIRIWRVDEATWIGAATHDVGIGFAMDERAFYHTIDPNVDREREKVVSDLVFVGRAGWLGDVDRAHAPRQARTATGDSILTDGHIAVVRLGVFPSL